VWDPAGVKARRAWKGVRLDKEFKRRKPIGAAEIMGKGIGRFLEFAKSGEDVKAVGVCAATMGGDSRGASTNFREAIDDHVDKDFKGRFADGGEAFLLGNTSDDDPEDVASEIVRHDRSDRWTVNSYRTEKGMNRDGGS
jgi:hypothetical protein